MSVRYRSNRNLEVLVLSLQKKEREPTTNSTQPWRRRRGSKPGHIGGRRVLSPLRHPLLSLSKHTKLVIYFEPQSFFLIFIARKLNKGSLSSRRYASSCKFTSGVVVTSDYVIYAAGVLLSVNSLRILQDMCSYKGKFKECTRLLKQLTAQRLF